MRHPLARIFTPIALIAGIALSTVALAGHHGMKEKPAADIVDVAVSAGQFNTLAAEAGKQRSADRYTDVSCRARKPYGMKTSSSLAEPPL